MAALGDEDVGGLDVSMNDLFGVRGVEAFGNLDGVVEQALDFHGPAGIDVLESGAVEKFHGDIAIAFVLANFVDGADVGMVQPGSGARLAPETFEGLRIAAEVLGKEFERNEAAKFGVFSFVDDAHSATTEFFEDDVAGDFLACQRLGVRHGHDILWWGLGQVNESTLRQTVCVPR